MKYNLSESEWLNSNKMRTCFYQLLLYQNKTISQYGSFMKSTMTQVTLTGEYNPPWPYESINMVVVLELQQGQEVYVRPGEMTSIYGAHVDNGMYSWFCGHLVYAF